VPALRAGRRADRIVALGGIAALKTIETRGSTLRIGAGVTYARLAADSTIAAALPDLGAVWRGVANVRVRHAATVGGNVMSANPQYDMLPALLALDAKLVFATAADRHETVAADAAAWPQGILAFLEIPLAAGHRFAFERSYKPVISLALAVDAGTARIAVGCAYARPLWRSLSLRGAASEALAESFARDLPEPISDWIASGTYRRKLARVILARRLGVLAPR
jgi:aerobic carbon-monoxide dehydrogenase medium subunit